MSRVERKEYQETKIMKSLSPVRHGSAQNVSQFDNNLDYLLEDLQSSVPARSNGTVNTYREVRNVEPDRSRSLNRVTHLQAANPITEYSSNDAYNYASPDGTKSIKGYKKETYSYSTSGDNKNRMQNNINQLDSLLDDLKQAKNQGSNNNVGIDPGLLETSNSKVMMGKRTVERELHYGDTPPRSSSRTRTLERGERGSSLTREVEYIDEGTYGETRPLRYTPSPQTQSTLTKQKQVTNVHSYPLEVAETTTPDINPEILANLDPNLLPAGNTKVTTTIKTYTYEIPGSGYQGTGPLPEPEKLVYSPNQSQTTPSKSFVYNKLESNDLTNYSPSPTQQNYSTNIYKESSTVQHNAPPYQKPPPPSGTTKTVVKETTRNYQPGYQTYPDSPPGKQSYIYNESTTTKTIDDSYPHEPQYIREVPSREPPRSDTYIIRESHNTTTNKTGGSPYPNRHNEYPPQEPGRTTVVYKQDTRTTNTTGSPYQPYHDEPKGYPPQEPGRTTVVYKQDTRTTNTTGSPYQPYHDEPKGYPPQEPSSTTVIYKHDSHHTNNYTGPSPRPQNPPNTTVIYKTETNTTDNYGYPPHGGHPGDSPQSGPRYPNEPYNPNNVNITYKYTTHSSSNNYKNGYPPNEESLPLTRPQPFPRDDSIDGPPKRVEHLMAAIGDEPPDSPLNQGFSAHEVDLLRQRKVDTLKQQQQQQQDREAEDLQKKERNLSPTKNISGPAVYYPPGHEMFARKEESGAWRAEGAMARESGKYMYESESGSKMKVKSGAAVVPVCLPLCCGLPCTII